MPTKKELSIPNVLEQLKEFFDDSLAKHHPEVQNDDLEDLNDGEEQ